MKEVLIKLTRQEAFQLYDIIIDNIVQGGYVGIKEQYYKRNENIKAKLKEQLIRQND